MFVKCVTEMFNFTQAWDTLNSYLRVGVYPMLQEISIGTSVIDRIKDNVRIQNQVSLNDKKLKNLNSIKRKWWNWLIYILPKNKKSYAFIAKMLSFNLWRKSISENLSERIYWILFRGDAKTPLINDKQADW